VKDAFKAVQYEDHSCGPGGHKCPCCGPAPKHRDTHRRQARMKLKRATEKEITAQLEG